MKTKSFESREGKLNKQVRRTNARRHAESRSAKVDKDESHAEEEGGARDTRRHPRGARRLASRRAVANSTRDAKFPIFKNATPRRARSHTCRTRDDGAMVSDAARRARRKFVSSSGALDADDSWSPTSLEARLSRLGTIRPSIGWGGLGTRWSKKEDSGTVGRRTD